MILNRRIAGILCILMTAGLLFAGLWPFDPSPKNRAYWVPNEEGLHFDGQNRRWKLSVGGIAYTPSPLNSLKPAPSESGSFTVDILLRPALEINSGVPHILGFVDSSGREVLHLGQWKQSLIVRTFIYRKSGKRQMRALGVENALIKGKTQRLTIASGQERTSIYLDGRLVEQFQKISLISQNNSIRGYSITLGNSRKVSSSWTGSVLGLELHERSLMDSEISASNNTATGKTGHEALIAEFFFNRSNGTLIPDLSGNGNNLKVPERVTLSNSILGWPYLDVLKKGSLRSDVVVNILGFVPFGFLFACWREKPDGTRLWQAIVIPSLLGALISLVIEVTQAFIPARDSSMVDVICNTGGAVLGAGCWMLVSRWLGCWEARKQNLMQSRKHETCQPSLP